MQDARKKLTHLQEESTMKHDLTFRAFFVSRDVPTAKELAREFTQNNLRPPLEHY